MQRFREAIVWTTGKYGCLGLINQSKILDREYRNSKKLSEERTSLMKKQENIHRNDQQKHKIINLNIKSDKSKEFEE